MIQIVLTLKKRAQSQTLVTNRGLRMFHQQGVRLRVHLNVVEKLKIKYVTASSRVYLERSKGQPWKSQLFFQIPATVNPQT